MTMKIALISPDLIVKLALGSDALILIVYAVDKLSSATSSAANTVLHPFPGFDAWMQDKWDLLTGKTPAAALTENFGVIDPNEP